MSYEEKKQRALLRDQVYLRMAKDHADLSKDPNTKVGAVIISDDNLPVSFGYNGAPSCFPDDQLPGRDPRKLSLRAIVRYGPEDESTIEEVSISSTMNKYPLVNHAEINALNHAKDPQMLLGSTLYVTHFPCRDCARAIVSRGVRRVVVGQAVRVLDDEGGSKRFVPEGCDSSSLASQDCNDAILILGTGVEEVTTMDACFRFPSSKMIHSSALEDSAT